MSRQYRIGQSAMSREINLADAPPVMAPHAASLMVPVPEQAFLDVLEGEAGFSVSC